MFSTFFSDVVLGPNVARGVPFNKSAATYTATATSETSTTFTVSLPVTSDTFNKPLHSDQSAFSIYNRIVDINNARQQRSWL